jgi:hypothetical protein
MPKNDAIIPGGPELPYFFIGDEAFALTERMMKGYPKSTGDKSQQVFNYRLSRARRIVENCFGMMANRFRILLGSFENTPENAITIMRTIIALHNFLLTEKISAKFNSSRFENGVMNGENDVDECGGEVTFNNISHDWTDDETANYGRQVFEPLQIRSQRGCHNTAGRSCREYLTEYFMGNGSVEFQWDRV